MSRLVRFVPLAGVAYLVLEIAGNGTIGNFPDSDTPLAKLIPFYAKHHGNIATGGLLLHYGGLALALFLLATWARIRESGVHPLVSGAALLGAALAAAAEFSGAGVYSTLGFIGGHEQVITPAALQAWHVNGAGGGLATGDGGLMIALLAISVAAIGGRALPRWLGWSALPLALVQLTPIGFYGEMLFALWAAVAGIYMTLRPSEQTVAAGRRMPSALEAAS